MSPRHVPASVTELSRVGLLSSLPGETLTRLADRMAREDVPAGRKIVSEGEPGDRFYVLLSGMATVSQDVRGMPIASATSPKVSPGRSTERAPRTSWLTVAIPERRT